MIDFDFKKNGTKKTTRPNPIRLNLTDKLNKIKSNSNEILTKKSRFNDFDRNEIIRMFLFHLPIPSIPDFFVFADVAWFCLSKVFDFSEILNSTQFVADPRVLPNVDQPHGLLSKRSHDRFGARAPSEQETRQCALKTILIRVLAFLEEFRKFARAVPAGKIVKNLEFAIFNPKLPIVVDPSHASMSAPELIRLVDLDALQGFYHFSLTAIFNHVKTPIELDLPLERGDSKTVRMKAKHVNKLLYVFKKTGSILLKGITRKLVKKFNKRRSKKGLPSLSFEALLSEAVEDKSINLTMKKENIAHVKNHQTFCNFLDTLDLMKMFQNEIINDEFDYRDLKDIDVYEISEAEYLRRRVSIDDKNAKRPWSLCEWQSAIEKLNIL